MAQPETRTLIAGRYEVRRHLGSGGLGEVFECWDRRLNRRVALKRLKNDFNIPQFILDYTAREATVLAGLSHPNIVRVLDFSADRSGHFFALEMIEGVTLSDIVEGGPIAIHLFIAIAAQTLEGLGAAHRKGLLHLDIKPANIMLQDYPDPNFRVKILDFGVAKLAEEAAKGDDEKFAIGSIYYISPEQLRHAPLDARTDLYSLGHVLYHLLGGQVAFYSEDLSDVVKMHTQHPAPPLQVLRPDIPAALAAWVHSLIETDPAKRPASSQQALHSLTTVSAKLMATCPPPPRLEQTPSPPPPASQSVKKVIRKWLKKE
jgi:serine/threonine protein kinase